MKLFYTGKDGGKDSTVWGFWLVEIKSLFSIALLCFERGSRDAYHNHAFNAISWVLSGWLREEQLNGSNKNDVTIRYHYPSWKPIYTPRDNMHKIYAGHRSWVLTFRGPWAAEWQEFRPTEMRMVRLTHGRKELN